MPPDAPTASCLVVGALTVDRFADGSSAAGGSVLHSTIETARLGVATTVLTVAGDEPAARAGLARLDALGDVVRQRTPTSLTYDHDESGPRRVLVYRAATDPIRAEPLAGAPYDLALLAPVGHELPPEVIPGVRAVAGARATVFLIQGWLRRLELGRPAAPLPLDEVPEALWPELDAADAVVLSTEDLADEVGDPFAQAAALRGRLGSRPALVLTLGVEGYLVDDPRHDRIMASVPRRVVTGVGTVGAGDTFGAALGVRLARGGSLEEAAAAGADAVIRLLESRR